MGEIDGSSERIDAASGAGRVLMAFPFRFLPRSLRTQLLFSCRPSRLRCWRGLDQGAQQARINIGGRSRDCPNMGGREKYMATRKPGGVSAVRCPQLGRESPCTSVCHVSARPSMGRHKFL